MTASGLQPIIGLVVTSIVLIAGASSSALADTVPTDGPAVRDLTYQTELRTEFGLRHDLEYLNGLSERSDLDTAALGIPLTPAETTEITLRGRLDSVLGAIESTLGSSPLYAGVSIDQAAGGKISLALTEEPSSSATSAALVATARTLLPAGVALEVTELPYSQKTLKSAYEQLNADLIAGKFKDFTIAQISQTPAAVTVYVSDGSPDALLQRLRSLHDFPFVSVKAAGPVDFQDDRNRQTGDLLGGLAISAEQNRPASGGSYCTSGYSFAKGGSSGTSYYEITAGHCGPAGWRWHLGDEPQSGQPGYGNFFGTATSNNGALYGTTSKCDCQSIGPVPASAATKRVLTSNTATFAYTNLPSNTNDAAGYGIGKRVCVSGATYGQTHGGDIVCGTIRSQNNTDSYNGSTQITNLIQTSIRSTQSGDSGAPVGSGGDFMGIHQGLDASGYELFSRSVYIESVTGARPTF